MNINGNTERRWLFLKLLVKFASLFMVLVCVWIITDSGHGVEALGIELGTVYWMMKP